MKITDINIGMLLYTSPAGSKVYDDAGENEGFFNKLFSKKNEPEIPFFIQRIEEIGRDTLYDDISEGYDAYLVPGAPEETTVVLSKNFLIIPGKEIFPLADVNRFAIYNITDPGIEQYATDRINEPYDPSYISPYKGEEGYELARFNVRLVIIDDDNQRYSYTFPLEIADRRDFRAQFNARFDRIGGIEDFSLEDVMDGVFDEERYLKEIL